MPTEGERVKGRKKILLPSGDTIYVPVITSISFVDPYDRYQQTDHAIDNSADSTRIVHSDNVHPVDVDRDGAPTDAQPTQDTSQDLFVERIDTWHAIDPYERYQETHLSLDNVTGNDQLPPRFTNHEQTHIYRYHQDPQNPDDNGVWVDSELIDTFTVLDPYERYQEKQYTLANPTNEEFRGGDLSGQAGDTDPDITIGDGSGEGTQDNPIRLDPFQNIINFSSGHYLLELVFQWFDWHIIVIGPDAGPPFEPPYTIPTDLEIVLETPTSDGVELLHTSMVVTPNQPVTGCNRYQLIKIYDVPNPPGNFTTDPADCFTWTGSMTGGTITSGSGSPDFEQRYSKTVSPNPFVTELYENVFCGPYPSLSFAIYSTNDFHFDEDLGTIQPNNPTDDPDVVFIGSNSASAVQKTPATDEFYHTPAPPFTVLMAPDGTYKYYSLYNGAVFELKLANIGTATIGPDETVAKIVAWPSLPVVTSIVDGPPTSVTYPPTPYTFGIYAASSPTWLVSTNYKFGGPPIDTNKYNGTNP